MQHHIAPDPRLGVAGARMAAAVSSCVHCGFCLPACPTYRVLGEEMDSPRGRIVLMKEVLEGGLALSDAAPHLERCLGCLACETACPSGVRYRDLIEPMRTRLVAERPWIARAQLALVVRVLESPALAGVGVALGALARPLASLLPASMRAMLSLLPDTRPERRPRPDFAPARGARRGRVALMTGCVQDVLRPDITNATMRVLAAQGVEVVVPPHQGCCGALARHAGLASHADGLARRHRAAFPTDIDALVTTAAGCGSAMKDHPAPGAPVVDAAEYLDVLGLVGALRMPEPRTAVYQDACHLGHAQRVTAAPRRLLAAVDGLSVVPIADAGLCCGSAGLYNIEQPALAADLGRRKVDAIAATGATLVVSGNIGCLTQLHASLAGSPHALACLHTMELLALAHPSLGGGE